MGTCLGRIPLCMKLGGSAEIQFISHSSCSTLFHTVHAAVGLIQAYYSVLRELTIVTKCFHYTKNLCRQKMRRMKPPT